MWGRERRTTGPSLPFPLCGPSHYGPLGSGVTDVVVRDCDELIYQRGSSFEAVLIQTVA
jgi:hypothetical protein